MSDAFLSSGIHGIHFYPLEFMGLWPKDSLGSGWESFINVVAFLVPNGETVTRMVTKSML